MRTGLNDASNCRPADGAGLFFERHALCRRTITAPALDLQRHRQFAGLGQIRDDEIRIQNLDVVIAGNIAGRHGSGTLLVQAHFGNIARMHADRDRLEIQQDVDDVFLHALDGGVFVQHAFDLDLGDGCARQRGQQHAPQRVAQGVTKTPFERFDHDARMARRHRLYFDDPRL